MYTEYRRARVFGAVALASFALVACKKPSPAPQTPAGPVSSEASTAAAQITADYLREQITKISADEFEGRAPATPGDVKARDYIVEQLKTIGFEAGGANGEWQQTFDVVGVTANMPKQWTFKRGGKSVSFNWWDDYIAGSGVQEEKGVVKNAEVVFVGYGIQAPEYGWDDFKGQDLKGKVLLMMNNDPDWSPDLFGGETRLYYGRWTYKYESAARQGAAGAIIIHTTPSAGYPFQVVQSSWTGEQVELPASDEPRIQVKGWLTEDEGARAGETRRAGSRQAGRVREVEGLQAGRARREYVSRVHEHAQSLEHGQRLRSAERQRSAVELRVRDLYRAP